MFCINCGEELKDGLKFCTNCGAKIEDDAPETPMAAIATDASQQPLPNRIQESKSSKAPTVVLVMATIVMVAGGTLASLAIVQPPIEFLKNTPFSSVKTETKSANENKTDENKEAEKSEDTEKNDASSSDKSSNNSSSNSSTNNGTFIFADSSERKLTEADVANLTDDQISIAQNEIWARAGRKFNNNWLQSYFNKQPWYKGTIEPDDFINEYKITDIENYNSLFLNGILNSHGYNVEKAHPN